MAPNSKHGEDYSMLENKTHFFDLFDLQYEPGSSPIDFYNQYRNLVIANLKKQGDIIIWQNSKVLEEDEELSPTFEDMIFANVLFLIDSHLPGRVKENYHHLIGRTKSLMDYRTDILVQLPAFITKIEDTLPEKYSDDLDQFDR